MNLRGRGSSSLLGAALLECDIHPGRTLVCNHLPLLQAEGKGQGPGPGECMLFLLCMWLGARIRTALHQMLRAIRYENIKSVCLP
jgi:hypothetical protein